MPPSMPRASNLASNLANQVHETSASIRSREPTEAEIRLRAFQIYQTRGGQPGREAEDWEQARRELTAGRTSTLVRP